MSEHTGIRGTVWFRALTGQASPMPGDPDSVLTADALLGEENARFLCVARDPHARFPCARDGQVGLEEAYTLAARVREVIEQDRNAIKRPIIAIVDVKSQAYGRREETAAIFLAAATAADAYGSARRSLHCPTIFGIMRSLVFSTNSCMLTVLRILPQRKFRMYKMN